MDVTRKDLIKRYPAMNEEELIQLYIGNGLTALAASILIDELRQQGISEKNVQERYTIIKANQKQIDLRRMADLPKVWPGFIFIFASIVAYFIEIILINENYWGLLSMGVILWGFGHFLVCVRDFHCILNILSDGQYAISSTQSIGFHFIPFYHIYWIFKWPIELSKFINNQKNDIKMVHGAFIGVAILISIPLLPYIIGIVFLFGIGMYIKKKLQMQIEYDVSFSNQPGLR